MNGGRGTYFGDFAAFFVPNDIGFPGFVAQVLPVAVVFETLHLVFAERRVVATIVTAFVFVH